MRKSISKSLRFSIFARDQFRCRYCGRQSDVVTLAIDHVMPVSRGGTNDLENLITSCVECNSGKGAKTLEQCAPSESDRLRIIQEKNEQLEVYKAVRSARKSREKVREQVYDFWCSLRETDSMDKRTLSFLCNCVTTFGATIVLGWIEKACLKFPYSSDSTISKYIGGCRKRHLEQTNQTSGMIL